MWLIELLRKLPIDAKMSLAKKGVTAETPTFAWQCRNLRTWSGGLNGRTNKSQGSAVIAP
jgi:hypothetical protein